MRQNIVTWVVYLMTIREGANKNRAVCEQSEWDAMDLARPGYHELIRGGIATEVEAEMLARRGPTAASSDPVGVWHQGRLSSIPPESAVRPTKRKLPEPFP